jgi:hypothetical protein
MMCTCTTCLLPAGEAAAARGPHDEPSHNYLPQLLPLPTLPRFYTCRPSPPMNADSHMLAVSTPRMSYLCRRQVKQLQPGAPVMSLFTTSRGGCLPCSKGLNCCCIAKQVGQYPGNQSCTILFNVCRSSSCSQGIV